MLAFLKENLFILTIFFGLIASVTSILSIIYKKKEHDVKIKKIIEVKDLAAIHLTRESMVNHMLGMIDKAKSGDTIWGQCVGCGNYTEIVQEKSVDAISRGVKFKVILHTKAAPYEEFARILESVKNTEIVASDDNNLRIQGLSDREVVMGFRNFKSYVGISIIDKPLVMILKNWFDGRFKELQNRDVNYKN